MHNRLITMFEMKHFRTAHTKIALCKCFSVYLLPLRHHLGNRCFVEDQFFILVIHFYDFSLLECPVKDP